MAEYHGKVAVELNWTPLESRGYDKRELHQDQWQFYSIRNQNGACHEDKACALGARDELYLPDQPSRLLNKSGTVSTAQTYPVDQYYSYYSGRSFPGIPYRQQSVAPPQPQTEAEFHSFARPYSGANVHIPLPSFPQHPQGDAPLYSMRNPAIKPPFPSQRRQSPPRAILSLGGRSGGQSYFLKPPQSAVTRSPPLRKDGFATRRGVSPPRRQRSPPFPAMQPSTGAVGGAEDDIIFKPFFTDAPDWPTCLGRLDKVTDRDVVALLLEKKREYTDCSVNALKEFHLQLKATERKKGTAAALVFGERELEKTPRSLQWRIYLDLAEFAKKEKHFLHARFYLTMATSLQPFDSDAWLERAKLEEEQGKWRNCELLLRRGLDYCPHSEGLMLKWIRYVERKGKISSARAALSRLRNLSLDECWKAILEGAMMEARAGNTRYARLIFKFLMRRLPRCGPVFQEYCLFEARIGNFKKAFTIARRGITMNSGYWPLWQTMFQLAEKLYPGDPTPIRKITAMGRKLLAPGLYYKLHLEHAQCEEMLGNFDAARRAYGEVVSTCSDDMLWKIWIGGAKTELLDGKLDACRRLLARAVEEAPQRWKSAVLLEASRTEEYLGNIERAREIVREAKQLSQNDWKPFLEAVLIEQRCNENEKALQLAEEGIQIHPGTGRIWAAYIQLRRPEGIQAQLSAFRRAVQEVPKSGEVWCEGARICMQSGEVDDAERFLRFAAEFTPQYGDTFIEAIRCDLLRDPSLGNLKAIERLCVNVDPSAGPLWHHCKLGNRDSPADILHTALKILTDDIHGQSILDRLDIVQLLGNTHFLPLHQRRQLIFNPSAPRS